jgi:hypothetical protein
MSNNKIIHKKSENSIIFEIAESRWADAGTNYKMHTFVKHQKIEVFNNTKKDCVKITFDKKKIKMTQAEYCDFFRILQKVNEAKVSIEEMCPRGGEHDYSDGCTTGWFVCKKCGDTY